EAGHAGDFAELASARECLRCIPPEIVPEAVRYPLVKLNQAIIKTTKGSCLRWDAHGIQVALQAFQEKTGFVDKRQSEPAASIEPAQASRSRPLARYARCKPEKCRSHRDCLPRQRPSRSREGKPNVLMIGKGVP